MHPSQGSHDNERFGRNPGQTLDAHFFGVSAQIMRRILVDAAHTRASVKRGGRVQREEHSAAVDFDQMPDT